MNGYIEGQPNNHECKIGKCHPIVELEEVKELLLLVSNALTDRWDYLEAHDPDQSDGKRSGYKHIRNTMREVIWDIAESKDIRLI